MEDFNIEEAKKFSKEYIVDVMADIMGHHPETGEEIYLVTPAQGNADGDIEFFSVTSPESDHFVVFTLKTEILSKESVELAPINSEEHNQPKPIIESVQNSSLIIDPNAGRLVGLDGGFLI